MSQLSSVAQISLLSRLAIAFISLVLCLALFHDQLSLALVARGDVFLRRGNLVRSQIYYGRVVLLDSHSVLAADRFAFVGYQIRTPRSLADAISVSSAALVIEPGNVELLYDRAMCFRLLHRDSDALADFQRAAGKSHDARMYRFAAWAAYRTGLRRKALSFWQLAQTLDPHSIVPTFVLKGEGLDK